MSSRSLPSGLAPGARIAVVAPGSPIDPPALRAGMERLRSWGYRPVAAPHLRARRGDLAGNDRVRLADLVWALSDDGIDAVWAARGGWGGARLLGGLPAALVRGGTRKWLYGFSDLTAIQNHLVGHGWCTWYAPLVADLGRPERYAAAALRRMLESPEVPGRISARGPVLRPGRARGRLAGGCLSLLAALAGTPWQPDFRGAILFLEEVGEAPYRIDRMLWQIRASGMLEGVRGLALGQFTACRPPPGRPSRSLREVLREFAGEAGVPCVAGFPCGHGRASRPLPLGYEADLDGRARVLAYRPPARAR
ncbi:MAG: LD-carboxypeptidase [Acidobacteria bacterium]|nr:MAG: LD-carboxypeptidase [Acidobacteriota bacterium]